jgi:membrane protein YdbS with pleckstrin-like domain
METSPEKPCPCCQHKNQDEVVFYHGPVSRLALLRPGLITFVVLVAAVALPFLVPDTKVDAGGQGRPLGMFATVAALALGAMALLWFVGQWMQFKSRLFRLTQERIEYETGIVTKRIENMPLWRVQDLRFTRTLLEAPFDLGTIHVRSSDSSDPLITIGPLPQARQLFEKLQQAQRQADRRQGVVHVEQ